MSHRDEQTARTILDQMNAAVAGPFRMTQLLGAKHLVALDENESRRGGLMFLLPYKYKVIIELTFMDDYTVTFGKINGADWREIAKVEGVYCDTLGSVVYDLAMSKGKVSA